MPVPFAAAIAARKAGAKEPLKLEVKPLWWIVNLLDAS